MPIITRLAFFLACAISLTAQTAPTTVSKNLLYEGTFAEHTGGTPVGWSLAGYAGGNHGNTVKVTDDRAGNYVTLQVAKPQTANFTLNLSGPISLKPTWKALICSVDIRVFNYVQGEQNYHKPRMHIAFYDDADTEVGSTGLGLATRYTDAWQTAERTIPIPIGATQAKIWLGSLGSTGRLEFRAPYIAPSE